MERFGAIVYICIVLSAIGCVLMGQSSLPPTAVQHAPLQVKVCPKPDNSWTSTILPCTFDNPTTAGSLGIIIALGGCNYKDCNSFSDTQGNAWNLGLYVPGDNGLPEWWTTLKAGSETITFLPGRGVDVIIAEYPCPSGACSQDDAAYADYRDAGLTPAGVEIQDNVIWAGVHRTDPVTHIISDTLSPVETTQPCELLVSWAIHGSGPLVAGPYFTLRADAQGAFALEDSTTTVPGYYLAGMSFRYPNSWVEGAAAFKMGGCQ